MFSAVVIEEIENDEADPGWRVFWSLAAWASSAAISEAGTGIAVDARRGGRAVGMAPFGPSAAPAAGASSSLRLGVALLSPSGTGASKSYEATSFWICSAIDLPHLVVISTSAQSSKSSEKKCLRRAAGILTCLKAWGASVVIWFNLEIGGNIEWSAGGYGYGNFLGTAREGGELGVALGAAGAGTLGSAKFIVPDPEERASRACSKI